MEYYVFKLNIQPNILVNYSEKDDFEYLVSTAIPNAFQSVLQVKEMKGFFQLIVENQNNHNFFELFNQLEQLTEELIEKYNNVLLDYKENGEIYYSKDFLNLNDKCMRERKFIESVFSGVKKAYEVIHDDDIDSFYKLVTDNKVGTGITHIKKFYKIKRYIDEAPFLITPLALNAYYNPKTEHILVETDSNDTALNYIDAFVNLVNDSKDVNEQIGKININPVYDSISLEGDYREISYTLVYPNGNPPLDRHNILKNSGAKEIRSKLVGSDGNPLIIEPVKAMLEEEAKKGYLKSLEVLGNKIFSKIKRIKKLGADF